MIEDGKEAPTFELPGVRDGEIEQISLSEYLGDEIVILAFYPGDFNPACADGTTDLDELDLFTMQKDVSILGLSADSVYSHRAFADEYDLHIPLLSDAHGEVAEAYGVAVEDESVGRLTRRAIVVLGPQGDIEYSWVAGDVSELPNVDEVRDVIQNVSGQDTAQARYRVGHAHYIEGRRAFTSAMNAYQDKEWMMANGDFDRAFQEFEAAEDEFNTAARFAETEKSRVYFEHAERKAESLWRAAEWLGDSANAYASGEGGAAEDLRRDAESPLETARDIHEPPSPDEFPPEEDPRELDEAADLGTDAGVSLDLDIEAVDDTANQADGMDDSIPDVEAGGASATAADGRLARSADGQGDADSAATDSDGTDPEEEPADGIDEAELEEIAAELEEQTEAAQQDQDEDAGGNVVPSSIDVESIEDPEPDRADGDGEDTAWDAGDEIELDLADPTDGDNPADDGADADDPESGESTDEELDADDPDDDDEFDADSFGGDQGVPARRPGMPRRPRRPLTRLAAAGVESHYM
ncbi:alkyl hydroperoxide reductase [Halobacteriales archaeon SW_10_66_29]|nr:MAG: alkyl hydroperoxide reductase [Halobacteriales archaeon SW_10_66_29]